MDEVFAFKEPQFIRLGEDLLTRGFIEQQIILATSNAHKIKEFKGLFTGCRFEISSAEVCGGMPQVVEDGDSFATNARIKAIALRDLAPNKAWICRMILGQKSTRLKVPPHLLRVTPVMVRAIVKTWKNYLVSFRIGLGEIVRLIFVASYA